MKKLILILFIIVTTFNLPVYAFTQDDIDNSYFEGWHDGYDEAIMDNQDYISRGKETEAKENYHYYGADDSEEYDNGHDDGYDKGYARGYKDAQKKFTQSDSDDAVDLKTLTIGISAVVICCISALIIYLMRRAGKKYDEGYNQGCSDGFKRAKKNYAEEIEIAENVKYCSELRELYEEIIGDIDGN